MGRNIKYRFALLGCVGVLTSLATSACDFSSGGGTTPPVIVTHAAGPPPPVQATPELSSLVLFGSGVLGTAGYMGRRLRRVG